MWALDRFLVTGVCGRYSGRGSICSLYSFRHLSVHTDGQTDRRVTGLKIVLIFNFSNFLTKSFINIVVRFTNHL